MANPVLAIDAGSTNISLSLVSEEGRILDSRRIPLKTIAPAEGIFEFDPMEIADAVLGAGAELLSKQPVSAVGITDQRASTMIWDRKTGKPFANMISWQDIRTVFDCLELQSQGLRLLPNQPATKLKHLLSQTKNPSDYCFGTPETWIASFLTQGAIHVSDASHAGLSGLIKLDGSDWDPEVLSILDIPPEVLPEIVDSTGIFGEAVALPGSPPVTGLIGDQQASLIGQACLEPGQAKLTLGTGGILDVCTSQRPDFELRGENGTFPVIAWRENGKNFWGIEGLMLNAGSAIDWAWNMLGLADSVAETEAMAKASLNSADSPPSSKTLKFVPAMTGLGTPYWDFGARGIFLGLDLSSSKEQLITAVLEGIANSAADLIEAVEADAGSFNCLRIDGGMSQNGIFMQMLANASCRQIQVSAEAESSSLGAAFLAGVGAGIWQDLNETAELYGPAKILDPNPDSNIRQGWEEAVEAARRWHPDLSSLEF